MILKSKRGYISSPHWLAEGYGRSTEECRILRLWIEREARAALELLSSDLLKDFQVINL